MGRMGSMSGVGNLWPVGHMWPGSNSCAARWAREEKIIWINIMCTFARVVGAARNKTHNLFSARGGKKGCPPLGYVNVRTVSDLLYSTGVIDRSKQTSEKF